MIIANATSVIHGHFYYVYLGDYSNNYKVEGLQEIIKCGIFIQFLAKNGVICKHFVSLKQNKMFPLFITFTLRDMSYLVSSVPPMTRYK